MKPIPSTFSRAACVGLAALAMLSPSLYGQAGGLPAKPIPQAISWLSFEPEIANFPPTAKFTNETKANVRVFYGAEKFLLKPGESKSVPIPNQRTFKLEVYEFKKDTWLKRVTAAATPNDQKRKIPVQWK